MSYRQPTKYKDKAVALDSLVLAIRDIERGSQNDHWVPLLLDGKLILRAVNGYITIEHNH